MLNTISIASSQEDTHCQNNKTRRTTRVTSHLPRIVQDAYEAVANGNIPSTVVQNPRPAANTLPRPSKSASRLRANEESPPRQQDTQPLAVEFGLTAMQVNKPQQQQQQQQQQHGIKGKQVVNVRDILTNAIRDVS